MLLRKVYLIKHGCTMSLMNVAFKPHIKNLVQKELKSLETFFKTVCRSMCIGWEGAGGSRKKFIVL